MPPSPMTMTSFDERQRFILSDYAEARPFASFLPGIAGLDGIPLWTFYVNRGQAIASFGIQSKDEPLLEFQPANKAYQLAPYLGFRTFLKIQAEAGDPARLYEPFSPWHTSASTRRQMAIGLNELELQELAPERGLQTNVLYFTLPHEDFAGLVRQVTFRNISTRPLTLTLLDGLPAVIPYGVNNALLKDMNRTLEAWMEVFNLENRAPFYRVRASVVDKVEVETYEAGHFALACLGQGAELHSLPALVDPALVFGANTSLSAPDGFVKTALSALLHQPQVTTGRTPCAFFGAALTLAPGEAATLHALYGHASRMEKLAEVQARLLRPGYLAERRTQATALAEALTDVVATQTSAPLFDGYCRQTFLDNVLRGGWPLTWGAAERPAVYHVYSRKHGDLERDYNAFYLAAEPYSQGNGSYRDVNQNRRCDVLFNPRVADFNVRAFMSLIQADGYNPLVIQGSTFTLPPSRRPTLLALAAQPAQLEPLLAGSFTPGRLLKALADGECKLSVSREAFLEQVMAAAEQHLEAAYGEGYWIDHWTYNLDLVDTFLAVYPDRKAALLFDDATLPFYDSAVGVRPRAEKYVLAGGQPRQLNAVAEDDEKAALLAARTNDRSWLRIAHGRGAIYRTTLFAKLAALALLKFATLDPWGMGIEMEAGRPGWYDALNGLPGLFGSSLPETFELVRLVNFLLEAIHERGDGNLEWPTELNALFDEVARRLAHWQISTDSDRDFAYWDAVATAREAYRAATRLGFAGETVSLPLAELGRHLARFAEKLQFGVRRALDLNHQLPPTYFTYQVEDYAPRRDSQGQPLRDAQGRPLIEPRRFRPEVLPLFLEGPVRAFKILDDVEAARALYARVRDSALFDQKLHMYKVNASLAGQPASIGRAQAFAPGWLENESIWLHMEYKYLLEVLRAGLYAEFFQDFKAALVPFEDPAVYGRSPLENSSFIVSSAHPDPALHGAGFVARLSGSTAEFLSMWSYMLAGPRPFVTEHGQLCLRLRPVLPGWLFTDQGQVSFTFLGQCAVIYHNPQRLDTFAPGVQVRRLAATLADGQRLEMAGETLSAPYAAQVRDGQIRRLELFF